VTIQYSVTPFIHDDYPSAATIPFVLGVAWKNGNYKNGLLLGAQDGEDAKVIPVGITDFFGSNPALTNSPAVVDLYQTDVSPDSIRWALFTLVMSFFEGPYNEAGPLEGSYTSTITATLSAL